MPWMLALVAAAALACSDDSDGGGADAGLDSSAMLDATGGDAGLDSSALSCTNPQAVPATVSDDLTVGPGCARIERTTVRDGATLTIAPGTTVLMAPGGHLDVSWNSSGGTLSAIGSAEQPILFTSDAASPRAGDWQCIRLSGGSSGSELKYVTLRYGGAPCDATGAKYEGALDIAAPVRGVTYVSVEDSSTHGVRVASEGAVREFANNTFARNAKASIWVNIKALLALGAPNTFSDADDFIEVDTTFSLSTSGTWRAQAVPYRIVGAGSIDDKAEVTIEAGTTIQLSGSSFEVFNATLHARGSATSPVTFTSGQPSPRAGDWGCVILDTPTAPGSFDHVVIEFAGNGEGCSGAKYKAGLVAKNATSITNSVFRNIDGPAILTADDCNDAWCSNTFEPAGAVRVVCKRDEPSATCP